MKIHFYLNILYVPLLYVPLLYVSLLGSSAKETLQSANQLSSLYRVYGKNAKAEILLAETLSICRTAFGNVYVLVSI